MASRVTCLFLLQVNTAAATFRLQLCSTVPEAASARLGDGTEGPSITADDRDGARI